MASGATDTAPQPSRRAALRSEWAPVALLFALVVGAWFPAVMSGDAITVGDALFALPPWSAQAPPGYRGPSDKLLLDEMVLVYPWSGYIRERWSKGQLPLWNPHAGCGTPFLANQNAAALSPFSLLLPAASDTASALTRVALVKLLVALTGAYALARRLEASRLAALAGASTFALSGPLTVWLGHQITTVSALLPWSLYFAEGVVRRPGAGARRQAALLGLVTAAHFLGGHPESSLHVAAATGAYVVLAAWRLAARRRAAVVALAVAGLGLGFAAALVQELPFLGALSSSHWRALRVEKAARFRVPAEALPLAWAPRLFGTPMELNSRESLIGGSNFAETAIFAGVLPLVLAPAAWRAIWRSRPHRWLGLLGVLSLVVAFDPGGIASAVLAPLPLVGVGAHHRLVLIWALAAAMLLARAIDSLCGWEPQAPPSPRAAFAAAAVAAVAVSWGLIRVLAAGELGRRALAYAAFAVVLAAAAAVLTVLGGRAVAGRWPRPAAIAAVALGLCLLDLWLFGRGVNPTLDPAFVFPPTAATSWLREQPGRSRILALGRVLPPNTAMAYGLEDVRAYEPLLDHAYHRFWLETLTPGGSSLPVRWSEIKAPQVLTLLGVRYLLDEPGAPPLHPRGLDLTLVHEGDARIYQVGGTLPRAFAVHAFDLASDPGAAGQRIAAGYPFRERVLLDREPSPRPLPATAPATADATSTVSMTRLAAERLEISVTLAAPGLVVVAEGFDPGWRAEVDGGPAPVLRADGIFMAVAVAQGRHRMLLTYRPRWLGTGAVASAIAIAALLLLLPGRSGWRSRV